MARTLIRIFLDAVATRRKPAQFLRKSGGRWHAISAERALADVESFALGLRSLGVGAGDRIVLLSETRYEWAVADLAILGLGAVTVPIYPTLTAAQCRHVLRDSEASGAIVSTPLQLAKLHEIAADLPRLKWIVHMEAGSSARASDTSWDLVIGRGAIARGNDPAAFRSWVNDVQPDDLATIIYTSGTTGDPKGAMLTHANISFDVESCLEVVNMGADDVSLSFLPLCHIFERMAGLYAMLAAGVTIAYAESLEAVPDNLLEVRPTIVNGVPRFYEKIQERILSRVNGRGPLSRRLFAWSLAQGRAAARARFAGQPLAPLARIRAAIGDALAGSKVRAGLGGRLRLCISGGAPLAAETLEFFFALRIAVLEGYGLTETSPVICLNRPGREKPGSVGPPIPGVEVAIGEAGEILTRGPHVMLGYYRNDEGTRLALRDGWFHTGDVGQLDPDGSLVITDRLKDLLVTAGGKKVAPQPIEARLKASPWISEAVLIGDRHPFIAALIVPAFPALEAHAVAEGWSPGSRRELVNRPEVRALVQKELDALNATLAPFEKVRKFALLDRELSQEEGEITPSLKVRRRVVMERFADAIEEIYGDRENRASA